MKPCPNIAIYTQINPVSPIACAAFFVVGGKHLPIHFTGPNVQEVERRARAWWGEEQRKLEKRAQPKIAKPKTDEYQELFG
jgi:hypothetical protein